MSDFIIDNPQLMNPTTIRATLINGTKTNTVELRVPEDDKRGVNKHFDYILDNYDMDDIREKYREALVIHEKRKKSEAQRQKNQMEFDRLKILFDQKAMLFDMPFMQDADRDLKAAIRRAPDLFILNCIAADALKKHMEKNNMSYSEYLDVLEELTYSNLDNELDDEL